MYATTKLLHYYRCLHHSKMLHLILLALKVIFFLNVKIAQIKLQAKLSVPKSEACQNEPLKKWLELVMHFPTEFNLA